MDIYYDKNKRYSFEMDKNGFPVLTQNNIDLINFLIDNDSNCRYDADPQNADSTYNLIRNCGETFSVHEIEKIVTKIDLQNSTHQASEGVNGGNRGRFLTAEYISGIDGLYVRLKGEDPKLVDEIAKAIPTRYTFSFASKYCNYMSRYLYEADGYSIYDLILCNILPYYAWVYLGRNYKAKKQSTISNVFGKRSQGDYAGYRNLIDDIRNASEQLTGYKISRVDFDHLLWYYYKGDRDVKDKAGNVIYKSRITRALDLVGNEKIII